LTPQEKKRFILLSFLDVVICVLDIASIAALLFIINFYMHPTATANNILPFAVLKPNSLLLIGIFLFFFCCKNLAAYRISSIQYRFVYKVASRLSEKKLLQYLEGTYQNYTAVDTAVHIKNISQQPVEFGHYILAGLQQIITQCILIACTIIAILVFNATLFILLLIILLPPLILIAWVVKKNIRISRAQAKNNSEKSLQYLKEALAGFVESKLYHRNNFFAQRYSTKQDQLNVYLANLQSTQAIPARFMEVFAVLGLFILIALNAWFGTAAISLLSIGAFMAAAYKIIPGVVKILNCSTTIKAYEYTIKDLSAGALLNSQLQGQKEIIKSIEFKNVSFNYKQHKILKRFSCYFKPGDMIGISGVSGKGKSTLINLLLGFEEATSGDICINAQPLSANNRQPFWKNIAYVKQQPFLIHDTVLTNITLGEIVDTERLKRVIKASGVDELIAQYPEGLEKIITENGKNISGGQRQRIVIARALYKNADLIILDEPFNELDATAEKKLLVHFKEMTEKGVMLILITHNKLNLSFCNTIISLDEN
jgi:ABC-type multidrug transport system fused ATPase/permease subunit